MRRLATGAGLLPDFPSPPAPPEVEDVVTEEAAVRPPSRMRQQVMPLVAEGGVVERGAAVACLRHAPDVCFVAPITGRVARVSLLPGRRLSEIVLFREDGGAAMTHDTRRADTTQGLRRLMQVSGIWPWIGRRPFGGMPAHDEVPSAIMVMAADTRPLAPDPRRALQGLENDFKKGVQALLRLTEGPVLVCEEKSGSRLDIGPESERLRRVSCGPRHPQGAVGIGVHRHFPADLDNVVLDLHAEDVAALGVLLRTGELPMMRHISIGGAALREGRTLRTHPGADLRQLTQRLAAGGPHEVMSGSPLDGRPAHWLAPRDRQITVLPRPEARRRPHWLVAALTDSRSARPVVPTAALAQAFGEALPAMSFVRALSAGDDEAAMNLGILSLLEEDVALADYVLSGTGQLAAQLRAMLDRIQVEFAA